MDNISNHKGFKVTHINIRSIKNKIDEMRVLLEQQQIDIMTISETWLTDNMENSCISIDNYSHFRCDRIRPAVSLRSRGGGLLTYVHSRFVVDESKFQYLNSCTPNIELQVLEIKKRNNKSTIIVNLYRPPSGCQNTFYEHLMDTISQLNDLRYHDIYVLGDINMDHTKHKRNDVTSNLIADMQANGFTQYINEPTRRTHKTATLFDVLYVKSSKKIDPFVKQLALSDHYMIGCC